MTASRWSRPVLAGVALMPAACGSAGAAQPRSPRTPEHAESMAAGGAH